MGQLLDLDQVPVLDTPTLNSSAITRGNAIAERSFAEFGDPLPRAVMIIRMQLFQMARKEFAKELGISYHGLKSMEEPQHGHVRPTQETFHALLAHMEDRQGEAEGQISIDIRDQLLELLVPGDTVLDFYDRMAYERGRDVLLEQLNITDGTFWQRRKWNIVPSWKEVRDTVKGMYRSKREVMLRNRRMEQGRGMWRADRLRQMHTRTLEAPLGELLVAMEEAIAEKCNADMTVAHITDLWDCTQDTAQRLLNGHVVPWEKVQTIVWSILPRRSQDLSAAWKRMEVAEAERPTFARMLIDLRDEHGIKNEDIARYLEIRPPEERREGYQAHRTEGYRPSAEIRRALDDESGFFNQVPRRALANLVTNGDDQQVDALHQQFVSDRLRSLRRASLACEMDPDGMEQRIAREWNGVTEEQLAAEVLGPKAKPVESIQLERRIRYAELPIGRLEIAREERRTWLRATDALGHMRTERAMELQRLDSEPKPPEELWKNATTIKDLMIALHDFYGSFRYLSEAMREMGEEDTTRLSEVRMREMANGENIPPLGKIERLIRAISIDEWPDVPHALLLDWYREYARMYRSEHPENLATSATLETIVHARATSARAFQATHLPDATAPAFFINWIRFPNAARSEPKWKEVEQVLLASDFRPAHSQWRLAKQLCENGGDMKKALQAVIPALHGRGNSIDCIALPGALETEIDAACKKLRIKRK